MWTEVRGLGQCEVRWSGVRGGEGVWSEVMGRGGKVELCHFCTLAHPHTHPHRHSQPHSHPHLQISYLPSPSPTLTTLTPPTPLRPTLTCESRTWPSA